MLPVLPQQRFCAIFTELSIEGPSNFQQAKCSLCIDEQWHTILFSDESRFQARTIVKRMDVAQLSQKYV